MGSLSIWHWLVVLMIVALVFGTKKLRNMGFDFGSAVKGFKDGMRDTEHDERQTPDSAALQVLTPDTSASRGGPSAPVTSTQTGPENKARSEPSGAGQTEGAHARPSKPKT